MNKEIRNIHQAGHEPIDSLEKLNNFISEIGELPKWKESGVLTDELGRNQLIILLSDQLNISLRLNLLLHQQKTALNTLAFPKIIHVRHLQGNCLKKDNLASLEAVLSVWEMCQDQSMDLSLDELTSYLKSLWSNRQRKGRGKKPTKGTLEELARASHGYCMFEGCGEPLNIEKLTGYSGNFAYNAHIIASSETGPRGVPYLSDYLSDNAENILVLCDKHHRLIDKVAAADYDAVRLSLMRSDFIQTVQTLLEGLSFKPIPAFSILWPVAGKTISEPDDRDIARSMSRIKARSSGKLNRLSNNERRYIKRPETFTNEIVDNINDDADAIIQQTTNESHKAALFAFGPMPALVGLGARLGNKCETTPMLRFRDGGYWMWPQETEAAEPYSIKFDEAEFANKNEVTICVAMTNYPDAMKQTALEIGMPTIEIKASEYGSAAIPHPGNGRQLQAELHKLLLRLKDEFSITKVHLLVCASNAINVFIGQAFDLYQPSLLVYDFDKELMKPSLYISYQEKKLCIERPT